MSPEEQLVSETAEPFSLSTRLKEFATGVLKGATTDFAGAPVDIVNEIIGVATKGKLKSAEPFGGSKHLRRVLAGAGEVEDKSLAETVGTMVNPENAAKAMLIGAARIPSRYKNYVQELMNIKKENPAAIPDRGKLFEKTDVYFDKDKVHKTFISDTNARVRLEAVTQNSAGEWYIKPKADGSLPTLPEVLDHHVLFNLVPEIKNIPLDSFAAPRSGSMALDNSRMSIGRNPNLAMNGADSILGVILHETQHAVQHIDRFAKGGNTKQFLSFDPTSVQVKLNKARESGDVAQIEAADRFAKKAANTLAEARNRYLNIPGEQEARYTQEAIGLDRRWLSENDLRADLQALLNRGDTPQTHDTRPIRPVK